MKRTLFISLLLTFSISSIGAYGATVESDFGSNVLIFDSKMPSEEIQKKIDDVYNQMARSEFSTNRYAFLFKPGEYELDVKVGYYTQVLGLGQTPDDVVITGAVRSKSTGRGGVLTNFWRACENIAVIPTVEPRNIWGVSQAAPFRRMHIKGGLQLSDGGYSSGGFISDSIIDENIVSGSQQQWFTRNSKIGGWEGGVWNMFFLGVENAPSPSWPNPPYTVIEKTPITREKPFLTIDKENKFYIFVPILQKNSQGITWSNGTAAGKSIPVEKFYIARPETDNAKSINAALEQGKNLLLTPGIYHLEESIKVLHPDTVILGLGIATLTPDNGTAIMEVADADGVIIAGILFDAGVENSPVLLQIGENGSSKDHSKNPVSLHDVFCRVGGPDVGKATNSVTINSNNVIGDHFWLWRADHGRGVGWDSNVTKNALIVNGDNVTIYGLFVEHYHEYQTVWNGNGGQVYFYQSEMPYDPPSQEAWQHSGINGYASYKVTDSVTTHEAWGIGVYCVFRAGPILAESAIETPHAPGIKMHRLVAIRLGGQRDSGISHVINSTGPAVINTQKATIE